MTLQVVNVGSLPGDGTGDKGQVPFQKVNNNDAELYNNAFFYGVDSSGAANTCTVLLATLKPNPLVFPAAIGTILRFAPANTNTGATTLNAVAVLNSQGAALTGGELQVGQPTLVELTGAGWQILTPTTQALFNQLLGTATPSSTFSNALLGATTPYVRTAAEIAASVVPTNLTYPPGNLFRYGFLDDGADHGTALTAAAAQAKQTNGAPIYLPRTTNGCLVASLSSSPIAFNVPVKIVGDEYNRSFFTLGSADFTLFTFNNGASGSSLANFQILGKGAGAAQPLVVFNGSSYNLVQNCYIRLGGYGIQYQTGGASCFLNTILNSRIVSNNLNNIDCQAQTNNLSLYATTFGGGPAQKGLHHIDSGVLNIFGGDCEGVTICSVDIDATANNTSGGHTLQGIDFEASPPSGTSYVGDIRLGASGFTITGVDINGITVSPAANNYALLNPITATGVSVRNVQIDSGYTGTGANLYNSWLATTATTLKGLFWSNVTGVSGAQEVPWGILGAISWGQNPLTGAAPALATSGTINTAGVSVQRFSPAAAVTGIVMQAGTFQGQQLTVINEAVAANTITFNNSGSSNVADGASSAIAGLTARTFYWDTVTALWYRSG